MLVESARDKAIHGDRNIKREERLGDYICVFGGQLWLTWFYSDVVEAAVAHICDLKAPGCRMLRQAIASLNCRAHSSKGAPGIKSARGKRPHRSSATGESTLFALTQEAEPPIVTVCRLFA